MASQSHSYQCKSSFPRIWITLSMRFCIENTTITLKTETKFRYLSIFHLTFFIKILNPICLLQAPQRLICRRLHFWPSHSLRRIRNNAILLWVEFLRGGTTNINIWLIPWSDLTPWSRNWFLKMNFTIQRIQSTFQWEKKYNVGSRRWWRDQPCPKQIWN